MVHTYEVFNPLMVKLQPIQSVQVMYSVAAVNGSYSPLEARTASLILNATRYFWGRVGIRTGNRAGIGAGSETGVGVVARLELLSEGAGSARRALSALGS